MKVKILSKNSLKVVDLNRRKAIRELCLNCSCWIPSEVSNCSFHDCPLYPFRSGVGKQNSKVRTKAIRQYCLWCCNGSLYEVSKCVSPDCPLFPFRKSGVDRSVELPSLPRKEHIEAISKIKAGQGI